MLLRNQDHFGLDHAGVAHHAAAGLDDGFGNGIAEMLGKAIVNGIGIGSRARNRLEVFGRKAAAEVDHGQRDAVARQAVENALGFGQRRVPGPKAGLLRAHMERNAVSLEAKRMGVQQHLGCHVGVAAELAAQRPFGSRAIGEDAAEHPRTRSGARNLFDFLDTIHREHGNAKLMRPGNVALFLDGVAVGDALRRGPGGQRHFNFSN